MELRKKIVDGFTVTLEKHRDIFYVKVDGDTYYKSANELFATSRFIDI